MKNVAKCDTWCELQNPVNHRVFERKLRPKPLGRGHVCLGISQCVAPPTHLVVSCEVRILAPRALQCAVSLKANPDNRRRGEWWLTKPLHDAVCAPIALGDSLTPKVHRNGASFETPGQAGLPAEFKHINKRRKRNQPGLP